MTTTAPSARESYLPGFPAFAAELAGTLAVQAQYVLHGNIRERFLLGAGGDKVQPTPMLPVLWRALRGSGYECLICYDPVDGIAVYPDEPAARQAAERLIGARAIGRRPSLSRLRAHLAKVVGVPEQPPAEDVQGGGGGSPEPPPSGAATNGARGPAVRAAVVMDYAARITRVPGQLDPDERDFFLYCQKLALTAAPRPFPGPRSAPLYNPIIWLVEGERDLPAWLAAGVDPIRTIAVPMPDRDERTRAAELFAPLLAPPADGDVAGAVAKFGDQTDGLSVRAMREIAFLARDRGIPLSGIGDAVRIYKLGVDDDPWRRDSVRTLIIKGEKDVPTKVMGQERAVAKTLDILKRSALGLSGAQAASSVSRPRGVLFFAGPTGVGKTELAKQMARILFGDPNFFLRFDMSEFSSEQSADRLIGAPPGYVGFEAGGELTGAVRRDPFQVVLFDEIEKAHPRLLDKFLQILEDGRLTDGQGVTTHFSGCVLIFTSNLGVFEYDRQSRERRQVVFPKTPYPDLEATIRRGIREYFTTELNRPELLNRFGGNIVVFDFITEAVARRILDAQLDNVVARVSAELGITLHVEDHVHSLLQDVCTADPANGGRGVGNQLESNFINPLARYLFDSNEWSPGATVVITSITGVAIGAPVVDGYVRTPR